MRSDWVISGSLHVAVLLAGLVTIAGSQPKTDLSDYVPVSIVTNDNLSRAPIGELNAPLIPQLPLADKAGDLKAVKQLAPNAADKPEISTASPPAPAMPQPKPLPKPQPKADAKEPVKPDQKTTERKPDVKPGQTHDKKPADFKPDQIAELLKKNQQQPDKPSPDTPKYDANQIAQLLDKRDPRRQLASAPVPSNTSNLGAPTGAANAQLSQTEIDALRERIRECWSPPPGVDNSSNISVSLRVLFREDGSLSAAPVVVAGTPSPLGPALAESGKRALLLCQPFTMLKPEHYAQWKDITINFDPHDLTGN